MARREPRPTGSAEAFGFGLAEGVGDGVAAGLAVAGWSYWLSFLMTFILPSTSLFVTVVTVWDSES